jgi:hypothetical protein
MLPKPLTAGHIKFVIKYGICQYMEDDALPPDRETMAEAEKRLYPRGHWCCVYKDDQGDQLYMAFDRLTELVIMRKSYPGNNAIYSLNPKTFRFYDPTEFPCEPKAPVRTETYTVEIRNSGGDYGTLLGPFATEDEVLGRLNPDGAVKAPAFICRYTTIDGETKAELIYKWRGSGWATIKPVTVEAVCQARQET